VALIGLRHAWKLFSLLLCSRTWTRSLVMNVTPSNTDWSEENDDVRPRDMEVDMDPVDDPVDAALERDLQRWEEQRDRIPSPPPSMSSAPHPQPSMSSAPDPQPSMSSAHDPQPSMSSGPDPQIEANILVPV